MYTRPALSNFTDVTELLANIPGPCDGPMGSGSDKGNETMHSHAYGNGLRVHLTTWEVSLANGAHLTTIQSKYCYKPGGNEHEILVKLRHDDGGAKQAYCESLLGEMMAVGWLGEAPTQDIPEHDVRENCRRGLDSSWMQDHDLWEEVFDFNVRIFGGLAGLIADQALGREGGGFLEDMTDLFDVYMLTFADVDQLHEGRTLLSEDTHFDFHWWVKFFLFLAYGTIFYRALATLGFTYITWFLTRKCKNKTD